VVRRVFAVNLGSNRNTRACFLLLVNRHMIACLKADPTNGQLSPLQPMKMTTVLVRHQAEKRRLSELTLQEESSNGTIRSGVLD